eukprot:5254001-Lingulodinium_polyedra.AAC.1
MPTVEGSSASEKLDRYESPAQQQAAPLHCTLLSLWPRAGARVHSSSPRPLVFQHDLLPGRPRVSSMAAHACTSARMRTIARTLAQA